MSTKATFLTCNFYKLWFELQLLILQIKLWKLGNIQIRKYAKFVAYNQCSEKFSSSLLKVVTFKKCVLIELIYK